MCYLRAPVLFISFSFLYVFFFSFSFSFVSFLFSLFCFSFFCVSFFFRFFSLLFSLFLFVFFSFRFFSFLFVFFRFSVYRYPTWSRTRTYFWENFIRNGVNDLYAVSAWKVSIAVLFIITSCLNQSVINNYFIIVRYLIMYPSHMQCNCTTICKLSSYQQTLKIQNNFYCSIHTIEYSRAFPEIIKTSGDRLLFITVISFHNSTRLLYHVDITNIDLRLIWMFQLPPKYIHVLQK